MEIPVNYMGNALIQITRIYTACYDDETLHKLSQKDTIVRKVSNYGSDKIFLQLTNVILQIVYCEDEKIYESINMNLDHVYLIKVIKLC
jgi:hypothetical protein